MIIDVFNDKINIYSAEPIGSVIMFAGVNVPNGWMFCNGQSLNKNNYPELYAAIGTAWGGNGNPNFNIPDMREAAPVGIGQRTDNITHDTYTLGQFKDDQFQTHTHSNDITYTSSLTKSGSISAQLFSYSGFGSGDALSANSFSDDASWGSSYIKISDTTSYTLKLTKSGSVNSPNSGRYNDVTRGKRLGINFIIKIKNII